MKNPKKIVCLGGGTGLSVVLSGLKKYPVDLTAVVTMFDSGGSSGKLRKEYGILPPGDIRQCLVALATKKGLAQRFNSRYSQGLLSGHAVGNIEIKDIAIIKGINESIRICSEKLGVEGKIVPVTLDSSDVKVILKDGEKLEDEESIVNCENLSEIGIERLFLDPSVKENPEAVSAIENADLIVIGPGKFYTSIIPNFLISGICEAIKKAKAKKVFVCNLMTQEGNTDGFSVEDFLAELEKYLGKNTINYVIFNTGRLSAELEKEVKKVFPSAEFIKYNENLLKKENFIGKDLLDCDIRKLDINDTLVQGTNQRTMVLHNPDKLAKIILNLCKPR